MIDNELQVTLRPVDADNVHTVIDDLSVDASQVDFVAPNAVSLAEAFVASKVWVRAIYAGEEPVGFAMLSDDDEQPRYYLWRFMIDRRHQRKGYGTEAMRAIHDYVRTRPGGDRIFLSYVPAEGGPQSFYAALGYVDTGRVQDGEVEAVLMLEPEPSET